MLSVSVHRLYDIGRYCQLKWSSPRFQPLRALPATNNQEVTAELTVTICAAQLKLTVPSAGTSTRRHMGGLTPRS